MATLIISPEEQLERTPHPPSEPATRPAESGTVHVVAQAIVLALLFAGPGLMCLHMANVADPDLWWHLRTGDWILAHHAVPRADAFSSTILGRPWADYTWLFETLVDRLFLRFGLVGIVAYTTAMVFAITCALYRMIRRLQGDFTLVVLLTFAAGFSMQHLYTPRPWLFTILFFVLVVDIVMQVRRTGKTAELLWLPVIFAIWPNFHIQFVVGLVVLGLAAAEAVAARWRPTLPTLAPPKWMAGAFVASLLASCLNPYGWHIYQVVYELTRAPGGMDKISELLAIPFRDVPDWEILLLAAGATAALGKAGRWLPFESALMLFAAYFSFRSQRDLWIVVVVAAAVIASTAAARKSNQIKLPLFVKPLVPVTACLMLFAGAHLYHMNNPFLGSLFADVMPVKAVHVVKERGYAGPLYNDYNWGGYLMWSMRVPVVIDGRGSLYGDQAIDRSAATWQGAPDWASDPQLKAARLVIGPVKAPLTQLLRMDAGYKLVYEDKIAAVFVANH